MKETKCTIIQDVLPLYIDNVVSRDTKEMVDKHLQHCENCKREYDSMKQCLSIPAKNDVSPFKKIKNKWIQKKVRVATITSLISVLVTVGVFFFVFYYEKVTPYSDDLLSIEELNNNQLVLRYHGESYASVNETHPMPFEIEGETKNVSFIFYTETIADSPSRNVINDEKNFSETDGHLLSESEKIDAVYYVDFDAKKIIDKKETWDSVLERAVLVWER